jgi:hypothetical protein
MERILLMLENPLALSPALLQFGLTGLIAATAGLMWYQSARLVTAVALSSRRRLLLVSR